MVALLGKQLKGMNNGTCLAGILQALADCVPHPLLEGREGRESIGKRGKDRKRRDFWEPSEGRGSHSSLKREEERSTDMRLHQR